MHSDDVRTFVTVVESGSISAAARELHLTQPAVSRRVQRLEHAIGAPLIDRRRRPFALTEAGRAAVERCRRLLSAADELRGLGQAGPVPWRGLRIGVAHALTELTVFEPVDHMRREFPAAVLRLHTGWSHELLAGVKSGALDAAVILLLDREGAPDGVAASALAKEHLVIVAAHTWRQRSYRARDLDGVGWVLNPEGCAARAELRRGLARARLPLRVSVETYDYELQLRLVARGRGFGLVPSRVLTRSPTRARLRSLRVSDLTFPFEIWMVTGELPPGALMPLRTFQRALADRL